MTNSDLFQCKACQRVSSCHSHYSARQSVTFCHSHSHYGAWQKVACCHIVIVTRVHDKVTLFSTPSQPVRLHPGERVTCCYSHSRYSAWQDWTVLVDITVHGKDWTVVEVIILHGKG